MKLPRWCHYQSPFYVLYFKKYIIRTVFPPCSPMHSINLLLLLQYKMKQKAENFLIKVFYLEKHGKESKRQCMFSKKLKYSLIQSCAELERKKSLFRAFRAMRMREAAKEMKGPWKRAKEAVTKSKQRATIRKTKRNEIKFIMTALN